MGKSSSLKKKRSKDSSQSRMRKRKKVKSKKSKSKKPRRRRDDSVSYSSDSDSTSMVSVSSFSTESDCSGRRSRSRNRKDIKGRKKKRSRRSFSSSEDSTIVKKRRESRRGDTRKRTGKRKKSMRDVSVSSRSSRSLSCSTSPSDNDEIEYEKRRGRPERKEKYGRRLEKVKRGSKRSKGQSRASSSCSRDSEGSDHSIEERVTEDSNFRRLKSVITVVEQVDESIRELIADEPKEDVYDYDDYPSCRSNDSNDGCSRWELGQHTHAVSETIKPPDDEQVEVSNIRTGNVEVINVSSAADGLNGDDIESILRQRALENLKKFRGELQKNINPPITPNDKSVGDVKTPSSVNTGSFQIKAPKADGGRVVIASDSSTLPKDDKNTTNTSDDGKCSETPGHDVASPSARLVPTGIPGKEVSTGIKSVSNKPRLVISRTGLEAPNARDTQKQETVTQEPSLARYVAKTSVDEGDLETAQAVKPSNDNAASVSNRPKSVNLRIGREPPKPNTCTTQKQESAALESPQAKFVTKTSVDEGDLETAQAVKPSNDNAASVSNRPKSVKLRIGREPPNTCTTQKQESAALKSPQAKFVTETSVKESNLRTAHTVSPEECGNLDGKDNDTSASTCDKPSPSGNISSDKQEDETKGGSQFQQKMMSVMRGGEMVQVSYQVYIPKRAPALARRQLKR